MSTPPLTQVLGELVMRKAYIASMIVWPRVTGDDDDGKVPYEVMGYWLPEYGRFITQCNKRPFYNIKWDEMHEEAQDAWSYSQEEFTQVIEKYGHLGKYSRLAPSTKELQSLIISLKELVTISLKYKLNFEFKTLKPVYTLRCVNIELSLNWDNVAIV